MADEIDRGIRDISRKERGAWRNAQREGSIHETHVVRAVRSVVIALPSRASRKTSRNSFMYLLVAPKSSCKWVYIQ